MTSTPAIPALVLVPGQTHTDCQTLYAIATAYAHSGLLISSHGKQTRRLEFTFSAIVCSSFANELFMKFFLMLDRSKRADASPKHDSGHKLGELSKKNKADHQRLIAEIARSCFP